MTRPERALSDCIEIRQRFLRSVNLEKDYEADSQNGDYILTPTAIQILRRVADGLSPSSPYRAWTVTGPYGVGKSAFAVFLTRVLCQRGSMGTAVWRQLEQADPGLAQDLRSKGYDANGSKGMLPLLLTARRAPAAMCLAEGVQCALSRLKGARARTLSREADILLKNVRKGHGADSRRIASLVAAFAAVAERAGHNGVLLVVDELGKLFEFAARSPQKGDVFALQEVAEQASRSGAFPVLFFGFLHQSFEEYGQHLDSMTRREWAKIHGRFEDVAFLEPADQVVRMIATAIKWSTGDAPPPGLLRHVKQVSRACAECGMIPPGMRKPELEDLCVRAYPLHPLTLMALPFIFRRFAQNERSLFSYLSSLEPGGFQEFLRSHTLSLQNPAFVRLDGLFDYFTTNFGAGLFRQPQARRWMEAADVLDRKEGLLPLDVQLVKTIGVLGALGDFCHLRAQEQMISAAVADVADPPQAVRQGLQHLRERSILTFRAYNHTYRIWEGSDVDIDDRVSEGRRKVRGNVSLAAGIQRYLQPRPLVARRHSFEVGAPRYLTVSYVDDPTQLAQHKAPAPGAAGQVLVCLSSSEAQMQAFREMAVSPQCAQTDLVIAIPQQIGAIQAALTELAAMRWAWENTPALRDDRVARREIALRIAEAEHFLQRNLTALLDPRKDPLGSGCLWYWSGERQPIRSRVGVSCLLSDVCDGLYDKAPRIRNELIARRVLSSAAAAARRVLIERMLTYADKPFLGIEGYPPERSMYESVLRAAGLHREDTSGAWAFRPPFKKGDVNLWPVWQRLNEIVFQTQPEPQPVDAIFRALAEPPYGVMDGLHPVLLCAFMMAYSDETTLYREGTFIPEQGVAEWEVLLRRPELFAVAGGRVTGNRAAVVARLASGFSTASSTVPVVRELFRMVKQLPDHAWRTARLSPGVLRVRDAFDRAKSPERFLYVDLPAALGLPPFPDTKPDTASVGRFFDALNTNLQEWASATPKVIRHAKEALLKACALDASDAGWQQLRAVAPRLEPRTKDSLLLAFLRRVAEATADDAGIASVLAIVAGRPPANWTDDDLDRFPQLAQAIGDAFTRSMDRAGLTDTEVPAAGTLTPAQREQAAALARKLEKKLLPRGTHTSSKVVRAALLILAQSIRERE